VHGLWKGEFAIQAVFDWKAGIKPETGKKMEN
jgi:hypothetical protein